MSGDTRGRMSWMQMFGLRGVGSEGRGKHPFTVVNVVSITLLLDDMVPIIVQLKQSNQQMLLKLRTHRVWDKMSVPNE